MILPGWGQKVLLLAIISVPHLLQRLCRKIIGHLYRGIIYSIQKTHETRDVETESVDCWAGVEDSGPTLNQQLVNLLCLLGYSLCIIHYESCNVWI